MFISFASADKDTARRVSDHLENAGISTFFAPRDISGGMNFALEIVRAISSCDAVVVLLSPAAVESPHVRREVTLAIDERRSLLPVALPGTTYPSGFGTEWTYWLSAVQVEDYDGPEQTLRLLRSILPQDKSRERAETGSAPRPQPNVARRRRLRRQTSSPNALLRPDSMVPALLGRENELVRLEQWCLRDDDFDLRMLTGAAGQGKTRLARELMRLLESREWRVRLLPPAATGVETVFDLSTKPTLLVLDYAETRGEQLHDMLTALLELGMHEKVRVLLLARTASDWWNAVLARDAEVADLVADVTIQAIEPLTLDRETVNELFTNACEQFAAKVGVAPIRAVSAPYKAYDSVLDVLSDALVVVVDASPDEVSGADRLLAHERRYLAASARAAGITDVDDVDLNRIAAGLTLYGAASEDEATQIVEECNRDLKPIVRRQVARLFRRLYPGSRTYVDGLRPDALAENLLAGILESEGHLPASAAGLGAPTRSPEQQRRALFMLASGAMRHSVISAELNRAVRDGDLDLLLLGIGVATQVEEAGPLSSAIATAVEDLPSAQLAILLSAVPDETVALAGLAAQLARRTIADLPDPAHQRLQDVITAMHCSNRFSDAGWSVEAAGSAQLAVDRLRLLDPDEQDLRVLGRALSNLSNRLWELGQLFDSLDPAREAVLHLDEAEAPFVERAAAHSNLAFRLSELGKHEEGLAEIIEAERLCAAVDGEYDPGVAKTRGSIMNNLACILMGTGDAGRAAGYGHACVELRRSQALQNRDRYLPYIARALANAAPAAEAAGDPALADRLLVEARSLHRLTGLRAPIYRFEEAESATLGSLILLCRGEWEASKRAAEEAQDVLRSLPGDLGELSNRLARSLAGIKAAAVAREELSLLDVACGKHATVQQPRLLEYRDL